MKKETEKNLLQHNKLTTARYEMNSCELDVFFYTLSLLKKEDSEDERYNISVKKLSELTNRDYNYQQFRESTRNLVSRVYELQKENEKGGINLLQVSLFASAEYKTGEGVIEIELSKKIRPYLFGLKNNFTSYSLQSALLVTSKYSKRFYQLFAQWKNIGVITYEIKELKLMLDLIDTKGKRPEQYVKFNAFKKNVLDVAVKQINELTELKVSFEAIKVGRSFKKIKFFINHQKPKQLPIDFNSNGYTDKEKRAIQLLEELGIVRPDLIQTIIKDHLKNFYAWNLEFKQGKIKAISNPAGLLLKSLGVTY